MSTKLEEAANNMIKMEEMVSTTQNKIKEKYKDQFDIDINEININEVNDDLIHDLKNIVLESFDLKHLSKENSLIMIEDVLQNMKDLNTFLMDAIEGTYEILKYMNLFLVVFKRAINIIDLSNDNYILEYDFIQKDDLMLLMRYVSEDEYLMATEGRIIIKVSGDVIGKLINAFLNSNNI